MATANELADERIEAARALLADLKVMSTQSDFSCALRIRQALENLAYALHYMDARTQLAEAADWCIAAERGFKQRVYHGYEARPR